MGSVLIEGSRIVSVHHTETDLPSGTRTFDLDGASLGPGLIDLHVHGADGVELLPASSTEGRTAEPNQADAVNRMARFLARHGVTGFMPATVTASMEDTASAIQRVRRAYGTITDGAQVLGIHLEGPFLSPERLGAQSPEHCVTPSRERVEQLISLVRGLPCIVTVAPEVRGGMDAIRAFARAGAIVAVGHSVADATQAEAAFAAGATQVTHLFNGMPPMHHRRPGIVGTALVTPGVAVELIADGIHLHPTTVNLAVRAKGRQGVLLVSDSMAATGCPDGEYTLGPLKVVVQGGEARLGSGALAGSTLTLERAVANVAHWTGDLGSAWQMASLNPARQLGIADRVGRLAPDCQADLVALDKDGCVILTVVRGEIVYHSPSLAVT
jgi:N-acetylglucosamine-6-phosphate deacetylase